MLRPDLTLTSTLQREQWRESLPAADEVRDRLRSHSLGLDLVRVQLAQSAG